MDLLQSFRDFVQKENLFSLKDQLLVTVSGGMDSVVLSELCRQAGLDFIMAHCNFRLRENESDRDEEFVRKLAAKWGRELLVKHFDTKQYAAEKKLSIQIAARELRYAWFAEILASGADSSEPAAASPTADTAPDAEGSANRPPVRILTAHHLDDNIETVLMNFFRGTGIAGLRGILPRQGNIVRPLLFAKKEELRQFAADHRLDWVEDSSNGSDKYARNYFRHQVIPLVTQQMPAAMQNIAGNIPRLREMEELIQQSVALHLGRLLESKGDEIRIPVLKLKKTRPLHAIAHEIIKHYGFSPQQVDEFIGLLDSGTGKYIQSPTHRILKHRNWVIIAPHAYSGQEIMLIGSVEDRPVYGNGELRLELLPAAEVNSFLSLLNDGAGFQEDSAPGSQYPAKSKKRAGQASSAHPGNSIALLDAATIQFPLVLRKWRQGDYFYPLGLRKKKKLGRLFIDNKLSLTDKEKIWVLEMDKKIVWVVGLRIDDRFRITPQTRQVLKIEARL